MNEPAKEIEGTWEEVLARGPEFIGRRVRLTLPDGQAQAMAGGHTQRSEPSPEQARLGIRPATRGTGSFEVVMALADQLLTSRADADDLWQTIAENRAGSPSGDNQQELRSVCG
jgi:hypothetical protein